MTSIITDRAVPELRVHSEGVADGSEGRISSSRGIPYWTGLWVQITRRNRAKAAMVERCRDGENVEEEEGWVDGSIPPPPTHTRGIGAVEL